MRRYEYVLGKTYEDAEWKLNVASSENRVSTHWNMCSFAELANEWLFLRTPQLKTSNVTKCTNMLKLYLLPILGDKQSSSISYAETVQLGRKLLNIGGTKTDVFSPKTVNSVLSLLKTFLNLQQDRRIFR
jgi:hypothetical protein